jgi:hypothetical protein
MQATDRKETFDARLLCYNCHGLRKGISFAEWKKNLQTKPRLVRETCGLQGGYDYHLSIARRA